MKVSDSKKKKWKWESISFMDFKQGIWDSVTFLGLISASCKGSEVNGPSNLMQTLILGSEESSWRGLACVCLFIKREERRMQTAQADVTNISSVASYLAAFQFLVPYLEATFSISGGPFGYFLYVKICSFRSIMCKCCFTSTTGFQSLLLVSYLAVCVSMCSHTLCTRANRKSQCFITVGVISDPVLNSLTLCVWASCAALIFTLLSTQL